jgi:hypothetical protein
MFTADFLLDILELSQRQKLPRYMLTEICPFTLKKLVNLVRTNCKEASCTPGDRNIYLSKSSNVRKRTSVLAGTDSWVSITRNLVNVLL